MANAGDFNLNFLWRLLVFGGAQDERNIFQVLHELRNVAVRILQNQRALSIGITLNAPETDRNFLAAALILVAFEKLQLQEGFAPAERIFLGVKNFLL